MNNEDQSIKSSSQKSDTIVNEVLNAKPWRDINYAILYFFRRWPLTIYSSVYTAHQFIAHPDLYKYFYLLSTIGCFVCDLIMVPKASDMRETPRQSVEFMLGLSSIEAKEKYGGISEKTVALAVLILLTIAWLATYFGIFQNAVTYIVFAMFLGFFHYFLEFDKKNIVVVHNPHGKQAGRVDYQSTAEFDFFIGGPVGYFYLAHPIFLLLFQLTMIVFVLRTNIIDTGFDYPTSGLNWLPMNLIALATLVGLLSVPLTVMIIYKYRAIAKAIVKLVT